MGVACLTACLLACLLDCLLAWEWKIEWDGGFLYRNKRVTWEGWWTNHQPGHRVPQIQDFVVVVVVITSMKSVKTTYSKSLKNLKRISHFIVSQGYCESRQIIYNPRARACKRWWTVTRMIWSATNPGFRGGGGGCDHEHEVCQDDLLQEFEEFEVDLPFYCESRLLWVKRHYLWWTCKLSDVSFLF